jgi:hypothetical protein
MLDSCYLCNICLTKRGKEEEARTRKRDKDSIIAKNAGAIAKIVVVFVVVIDACIVDE